MFLCASRVSLLSLVVVVVVVVVVETLTLTTAASSSIHPQRLKHHQVHNEVREDNANNGGVASLALSDGIVWPKNSVEEEDELSPLHDPLSSSYVPQRYRRQDDTTATATMEDEKEDSGMIIIPGIAQLLPKFDELARNQSVLFANEQATLERLLRDSLTGLRREYNESTMSVKSLSSAASQETRASVDMLMRERLNNSASKMESILNESTNEMRVVLRDSAENVRRMMRESTSELRDEFGAMLNQSSSQLKQMLNQSMTEMNEQYKLMTQKDDLSLRALRQNTYDEFTDVKSQLNGLEKIVRAILLQQQQQFMRFAFEGAYPMMPPMPYYPITAGYYPPASPFYPSSQLPPLHPSNFTAAPASSDLPVASSTPPVAVATTTLFDGSMKPFESTKPRPPSFAAAAA